MQWPASMRATPSMSVMRPPASSTITMSGGDVVGGDLALEHHLGDALRHEAVTPEVAEATLPPAARSSASARPSQASRVRLYEP